MTVQETIRNLVHNRDRISTAEVANALLEEVYQEQRLNIVNRSEFEQGQLSRPILWRGSISYVKDVIKNPRVVEAILNDNENQQDLFGFNEFVCLGDSLFARRKVLHRNEYLAAVEFLKLKRKEIGAKIKKFEADYTKALPFWGPEMTFAEAYALAPDSEDQTPTTDETEQE